MYKQHKDYDATRTFHIRDEIKNLRVNSAMV
jgi:hypothetical protein